MLIEQYIYTRLSAEQSPHKSTGFQTVFMPEGLIGKLNKVSIESHIHLHSLTSVLEKRTVFWVEMSREFWQVILFVKALPQARDEFGRGGIFLVHGFVIPPDVWMRYTNPLRLSNALERLVFEDIDSMLASPMVNFEKRSIASVDIGVLPELDAEQNDQELMPLERKMLVILTRMLRGDVKGQALVYQGNHRAGEQFFARLAGFLPSQLKHLLAWDSAFDSGKLFFSPHNLVAYSTHPPVTGMQVVYRPGQEKLDFTEPGQQQLVSPDDPFTNWICECADHNLSVAQIDGLYSLSNLLVKRMPFQGVAATPCFAKVNEFFIREWLRDATDPLLPPAWRPLIYQHVPSKDLQMLAVKGFQDQQLAVCIAKVIMIAELHPGTFKVAPPASLAYTNEPRFSVLSTMWSKSKINPHWLLDIVVEERERILVLLARNGMTQEEAAALGFTEDEIKVASSAFLGGLGRFFKRFLGN